MKTLTDPWNSIERTCKYTNDKESVYSFGTVLRIRLRIFCKEVI